MSVNNETVTVETEELYFPYDDSHCCWDAIIEVECGYEEEDRSVGYSGGPFIEEVRVVKYILTDNDGEELGRWDADGMRANGGEFIRAMDTIDGKADTYAHDNAESIYETAGEQAEGAYEAAMEAKFDAMREDPPEPDYY
jgi:hypothetical protein